LDSEFYYHNAHYFKISIPEKLNKAKCRIKKPIAGCIFAPDVQKRLSNKSASEKSAWQFNMLPADEPGSEYPDRI